MHIIRLGLVILASVALSGAAGDGVERRVGSSEAAATQGVVASLRTVAGLLSKRRADHASGTRVVIAGLRG
jgi:hypothetical protein